jgi:uncharacterized protein
MNWETAKQALDFGFSHCEEKSQLGFFGGEPLLEWDLLVKSTLYAEKIVEEKGIVLQKTVTTNGTLLTKERAKWLFDHDFYPGLSIDGNRAMHEITRPLSGGKSSFDSTIKGLKHLKEFFPDLEIILVPDPSNIHLMTESVKYLFNEQGIYNISINPNFYTEWEDDKLELWEKSFEDLGDFFIKCFRENKLLQLNFIEGKIITHIKNGFEACDKCGFAEKEFAVAPSGRIYGCERLIGNDTDEDMVIGDVFNGFDEKKRLEIIMQRGSNTNPDCLECSLKKRCMNWCHCINYATTGSIAETDGIVCFHERIAIRVADRVGEVLYKEKNHLFLHHFYGDGES